MAYDPSSIILSGGAGAIQGLITAVKDDLPVLVSNDGHTSYSYTPAGSTAFDTIDTVAITAESDEIVLAVSTLSVSGTNTSHTWYIRHNVSGETLSVERQQRFLPPVTSTAGQTNQVTVVTVFSGMSGAKNVLLQVGNSDSGPTSVFHSNVGNTYIFQFKFRSA